MKKHLFAPSRPRWERPQITLFWEGINRPPWREPLRRLYDHQIVYCSRGKHILRFPEMEYRLTPGTIALIPPGIWHESILPSGEDTKRHCVLFAWIPDERRFSLPIQAFEGECFDPRFCDQAPEGLKGVMPFCKKLGKDEVILVEMFFAALRKRDGVGLHLLNTLLDFWLGDKPTSPGLRVLHRIGDPCHALKTYLEESYAETEGYGEFCRVTGLSPSHLCRSFKKLYRVTPTQYLIQLRLTHARRRISAGVPVAAAARGVGIRDANYFARLFKKYQGINPAQIARLGNKNSAG